MSFSIQFALRLCRIKRNYRKTLVTQLWGSNVAIGVERYWARWNEVGFNNENIRNSHNDAEVSVDLNQFVPKIEMASQVTINST